MENIEEKIVKVEITLGRVFFPRGVRTVESGQFAIFTANVEKVIDGEYEEKAIKLKGNVCTLDYEDTYSVTAKLADVSDQYGETYEIIFINRKVSLTSEEDQKTFLKSILSDNVAENLFNALGEKVIEVLESEDVESLCKVKGVGVKTASKLIQKYQDSKDYSAIYTQLAEFNLTTAMIKKLVEFYKSPDVVVEVIKDNPYVLVEVDGVGFKKADEIAIAMGIGYQSPKRLQGFLFHYLSQEGEAGKSYVTYGELVNAISTELGEINQEVFAEVANNLVEKKVVMVSHEGNRIGLMRYFNLEKRIAEEIVRLRDAESFEFNIEGWEEIIKKIEEEQGWGYTLEQKEGIFDTLENNVTIVTAKAGAGKTTIANGMCAVLSKYNIAQCALSGKASVRMTEATGRDAQTIHRLLGYNPSTGYAHNKECPLSQQVFIIDESSMINGDMFLRLLEAIPSGAKVVMLGDTAQLTSIGNCNVFADLIASEAVKIVRLKKIHRQGARSGILSTSLKVSNQEQFLPYGFTGMEILGELQDMEMHVFGEPGGIDDLVVQKFMSHYNRLIEMGYNKVDAINAVQVIVPMRLRGDLSTYNVNNKIQQVVNPMVEGEAILSCSMGKDKPFIVKEGDKVVNTKNNYKAINEDGKKVAIFNGSTGIVREVWENGCIVDFVGIDTVVLDKSGISCLELAYAMTTHKLQGSQTDVAIVAFDSSAYKLLNIELLYTALTRAKKYCSLWVPAKSLRTATTNQEGSKKQTYFCDIIKYLM